MCECPYLCVCLSVLCELQHSLVFFRMNVMWNSILSFCALITKCTVFFFFWSSSPLYSDATSYQWQVSQHICARYQILQLDQIWTVKRKWHSHLQQTNFCATYQCQQMQHKILKITFILAKCLSKHWPKVTLIDIKNISFF